MALSCPYKLFIGISPDNKSQMVLFERLKETHWCSNNLEQNHFVTQYIFFFMCCFRFLHITTEKLRNTPEIGSTSSQIGKIGPTEEHMDSVFFK